MTSDRTDWFRRAAPTAIFLALTAVMTWPQPLVIGTHTVNHHDVLFNLWRLRWIAHALATAPSHVFDANIFTPERGTLALSDAMLLEGFLAAPLFWIGLPPVFVHNVLLLGAIAASGVGAFMLARHLFGSASGGIAAGIVFAFAPYRIEHYMHMELQWAMWIPWAFWCLQRSLSPRGAASGGQGAFLRQPPSGAAPGSEGAFLRQPPSGAAPGSERAFLRRADRDMRYGVLMGVFMALQMLSSIYYGIFLLLFLPLVAIVQMLSLSKRETLAAGRRLAVAVAVAVCVSALYAIPYSRASARVGHRGVAEVTTYSAKPRDYLAATDTNLLYGARVAGRSERRLFPGLLAPLLALIGLLLLPPSGPTVAYLIGGVAAFEISLGMYGVVYPFLYDHFRIFEGLRAPARASIFCLLFLGVLAARGCAALEAYARPVARKALAVGVLGGLLVEYWVAPLGLVPHHNTAPPLYAWLAQQPRGIVAEFPMPKTTTLPGPEPRYAYMSTFHWMPTLNGYSGYYPPSYLRRLDEVERFPDARAMHALNRAGVRYLIVHAAAYAAADYARIEETLVASGVTPLGRFSDGTADAVVFLMR